MASADEVAAIFASAWTAGGGARLSADQVTRLGALWDEAHAKQPDLDAREFAIALAGLAPGLEGLGSFLGNQAVASSAALAATMARGSVMGTGHAVSGLEATMARGTAGDTPLGSPAAGPRKVPERYRIIKRLGAGAMGEVWEAEDKQLHRKVALKWVTQAAAGDRGYRARLLREARALAQIHHPNVMAVYDVGEAGDELYIALELIAGTTARDAKPSLEIWKQVGAGLAAAHAAGIVHRDVKPENVFVAHDGRVVVGDFGLATGELGETMATNLTATGAVVGTPLYMPPEQLHGDPATAKGDQFSLCVCAWEALAGRRPFDSQSIAGLAVAMLKPAPIPATGDRRIFAVLQRGLLPEAADRWPDIPSLLAALDQPAQAKRSMGPIIAALAVGAVGALAIVKLTRSDPPAAPTPPPPPIATAAATPVAPMPDAAAVAPPPPAGSNAVVAAPPVATPKAAGSATKKPTRVADADPDDDNKPYQKPHWREEYDGSIDAMQVGDGKKCLALIADRASWPPDASRELLAVESSLGSCMMAAGDCEGGHRALEAFGAQHNLTAEDVQKRAAFSDGKWCALDAQPASFWPSRAAAKLEKLAYAHQSCKPVLDFVAAHNITLPPDPMRARPLQMVMCMATDGDCAGARALFLKDRASGATGAVLDQANHSFDLSFPRCAGT